MTGVASWSRLIGVVTACLALISSTAASAQSSMDGVNRSVAEADAAYQNAEGSARWFNYEEACSGYTNAIELYTGAIRWLPTGLIRTDADAAYLRGVRDSISAKAYSAGAAARAVCGRPNGAPPSSSNSTSSPPSADYVDYDFQKSELQSLVTRSKGQSNDALSKYEARDFVGACSSARLAAEGWDKVVQDMKANSALEPAFANPAQIYTNAKAAAEDRDEVYCKGQG
jgi:hypothetical protein